MRTTHFQRIFPLKTFTNHIHDPTEHTAAIHAHHSVIQKKIQRNHMKSVI